MPGWHAAQVADFGFGGWKTTKDTATDDKLAYRKIGKYNNNDVYYAEIKLPRWSKELDGVNIEDVSEDARTMIGYRIPTEGKQSVIIMRVVEFLPDVSDSTVVLPENWVHQSGSDYDVDSVYAMTFGLTKGKDGKVTVYNDKKFHLDAARDSEESKIGYVNYVLSNIDKIARRKIRDYVDKAALTKDEIKAQSNAEREKLNADYYEAVKARIDSMYKSVDGIWKSAKIVRILTLKKIYIRLLLLLAINLRMLKLLIMLLEFLLVFMSLKCLVLLLKLKLLIMFSLYSSNCNKKWMPSQTLT